MKVPCLNCGAVWSVSKNHKGVINQCYFCPKNKLKKEYKAELDFYRPEPEMPEYDTENNESEEDNEPKRRTKRSKVSEL